MTTSKSDIITRLHTQALDEIGEALIRLQDKTLEIGEIPRRFEEWTDCEELWSVLWWDVEHTDGVISEPPEYIGCPKDGPWPWREEDQPHLLWVPLPKLARGRP